MNTRRRLTSTRDRDERWRREDEARRLLEEIPTLESLRLVISERAGADSGPAISHTKRFVLDYAPAHFEIPCSERKCEGGGYDITPEVMRGLAAGKTRFAGEIGCSGTLGDGLCERTMHWVAEARYVDEDERADAA